MEYTNYRDGGTKSFKASWFKYIFDSKEEIEICLDKRIHSETYGEWYLGYPEKGRLLTEEEVEKIVPGILTAVEADVNWRMHYLESLRNPKQTKAEAYEKQNSKSNPAT